MSQNLGIVLTSALQVFGLVAFACAYARRFRPDLNSALRLTMQVFVPCLAFTAILDSRIATREVATAVEATLLQIGSGLLLGFLALCAVGWREKRELLLPIAFVNSANIPFPLLLANYGPDGLSLGVVCYTVTNLAIFSVGVLLLNGGGRIREALREPALWASATAGILRALHLRLPEAVLAVPRLAAAAAIPLMLVLFGDALARTRLTSTRPALLATFVRYGSGAVGLWITLWWFHPEGLLRKVLILYALLPPAVINVLLTRRAGKDEQAVASAVLLATVVSVALIPLLLATLR